MDVSALLLRRGDRFEPTGAARGPWNPNTLSGPVIAGLIGRTLEAQFGTDWLNFTRLTVDLFRQPPFAALTIATQLVRDGNRIRVADAIVASGDIEIARGRGVLLRRSQEPPGEFWTPAPGLMPLPEDLGEGRRTQEAPIWEMKSAGGGLPVLAQTDGKTQRRLWLRPLVSLIEGEKMTPFTRVALCADLTNPLANGGSQGVSFINADLTLYLQRLPAGEWIGLEVSGHASADGVAIGEATVYDERGPIGKSLVAAIANQRSAPYA